MNIRIIVYIIGYALMAEGVLMLGAVITGFCYGETARTLIYNAFACLAFLLGFLVTRRKPAMEKLKPREAIVIVPLTWLVLGVIGCMPFIFTGDIPSFTDAMFEMISGFTTTGSTITENVETLTHATNFWRCFSHWIGGMGILVFVLTILPLTNGSTMNIMKAESPGPEVTKIVPKVRNTSAILYGLYAALTALEVVILLINGCTLYESLCTSFGTAGTGGFGIYADSIGSFSQLNQYVIAVFMILFGVNFNAYYFLWKKQFSDAFHMEELRWYFGIIAVAVAAITVNIKSMFPTLEEAFRHALFTVASIQTTTGFATVDFDLWPVLSKTLLLILMFIGACAGSTGGGMKVSRIAIMLKSVKEQLSEQIHPQRVRKIHFEGKPVSNAVLNGIYTYFLAYVRVYIVSLIIISFDNFDFFTNFSAVAATINNIGPGFNKVGATCNFAGYSDLSKWVLTFDMLAGRLEIIPCLVLFFPETWAKKTKR